MQLNDVKEQNNEVRIAIKKEIKKLFEKCNLKEWLIANKDELKNFGIADIKIKYSLELLHSDHLIDLPKSNYTIQNLKWQGALYREYSSTYNPLTTNNIPILLKKVKLEGTFSEVNINKKNNNVYVEIENFEYEKYIV